MLIRFYIPMHILFQAMPLVGVCSSSIYAARCFRKRQSIPVNRCVYIFVFAMYMLFAYYLIIRPFAGFSLVAAMTKPTTQLIPFHALMDFAQNSGIVLTDASTWIPAFTGSIFRGIVLNILLFVPIGFFLRGVCGTSIKKALLISFLICLFFELTQLSSLYFIYPRPYRIFDVDDFITNLLGAWLGTLIAPPIMRRLPSPSISGGRQIVQGNETPLSRRIGAMVLDNAVLIALALFLADFTTHVFDGDVLTWSLRDEMVTLGFYLLISIAYAIVEYIAGGKTIGLWIFKLRLTNPQEGKPSLTSCLLRSVLFTLVWSLPSVTFMLISTVHHGGFHLAPIALILEAVILCFQVYFYLSLALGGISKSTCLFYERWSRTRLTQPPA